MARRSDSTTNGASTPAAASAAVMAGCSGPSADRTDRAPAIATAAPAIEAGSTPADRSPAARQHRGRVRRSPAPRRRDSRSPRCRARGSAPWSPPPPPGSTSPRHRPRRVAPVRSLRPRSRRLSRRGALKYRSRQTRPVLTLRVDRPGPRWWPQAVTGGTSGASVTHPCRVRRELPAGSGHCGGIPRSTGGIAAGCRPPVSPGVGVQAKRAPIAEWVAASLTRESASYLISRSWGTGLSGVAWSRSSDPRCRPTRPGGSCRASCSSRPCARAT